MSIELTTSVPTQLALLLKRGQRLNAGSKLARVAPPYPHSDCRRVSREARLVVATSEGLVYVFALDTAEGGECALLRTHRLADTALAPRPPSEGTCALQ